LSAIMCSIDVRLEIVNAETAHRYISGVVIETRCADLRHLAPGSQAGRGDFFPVFAAVACDPNQAIFSAGPLGTHILELWSKRIDRGALHFRLGVQVCLVPHASR